MAAVVSVVSRCDLSIDVHCENQPKKGKLELYKPSTPFNSCLKWLYTCNEMKHFSYKGGVLYMGIIYTSKTFKRRVDLGYR